MQRTHVFILKERLNPIHSFLHCLLKKNTIFTQLCWLPFPAEIRTPLIQISRQTQTVTKKMGRQKHFSFFSVVWPLKNPEFPLSCTAYVDQEIIWYPMKPRICTCVNAPNRIRTDISRFRSHFGRICFYIYSALFLAPYYSLNKKERKLFSLPLVFFPFYSKLILIVNPPFEFAVGKDADVWGVVLIQV